MKYILFFRENNNFDDIVNDAIIKKLIKEKLRWYQYLSIGIVDDDKTMSYITLKFGDSVTTSLTKDYSPVPFKDYIPKRS